VAQASLSNAVEQRASVEVAKPRRLGEAMLYWVPTILVVLNAAVGGVFDAIRAREALDVFRHLGYPDYFATLLGVAKVLGGVALVAPIPRTLREWAYAGLTFDVIAAIASIVAVGDPVRNTIIPMLFLVLTWVSFTMWRRRVEARGLR